MYIVEGVVFGPADEEEEVLDVLANVGLVDLEERRVLVDHMPVCPRRHPERVRVVHQRQLVHFVPNDGRLRGVGNKTSGRRKVHVNCKDRRRPVGGGGGGMPLRPGIISHREREKRE